MVLEKSVYDKLKQLKKPNETFDDVINNLINIDKKYNTLEKTLEFSFETETTCKNFRITYGNNDPLIEYYNPKGWSNHISAWDNYPRIHDNDKDLFINFILDKSNVIKLQNLDVNEFIGKFEFNIIRIE